jgi:hypothetical protein
MQVTQASSSWDPYQAGDPDVQPIATRQLLSVPNRYVVPFLNAGMTPRDAYHDALHGMM